MHWFEQVRLYESVAEPEGYMTEQQKIMNLNIAVQSNRELATVDTTFKSMLSMDKTKVPTIAQLKDLLLSAAVNYDRAQGTKGGRNGSKAPSRQVYSHEIGPTYDFDIDTPLFEVMRAETTRNGDLEVYHTSLRQLTANQLVRHRTLRHLSLHYVGINAVEIIQISDPIALDRNPQHRD
jgi:hypothetical protein